MQEKKKLTIEDINIKEFIDLWYVSYFRLCNFHCSYCASFGAYSKSNTTMWYSDKEKYLTYQIIHRIGLLPHNIRLRLGTLGEPFTSIDFLKHVGEISLRDNISFIELLSNGSLIKKNIHFLENFGSIKKISLWITYHTNQIDGIKLLNDINYIKQKYNLFIVINVLLFPDNFTMAMNFIKEAKKQGNNTNIDLGYDFSSGHFKTLSELVPLLRNEYKELVNRIDLDNDFMELLRSSISSPLGRQCYAGSKYYFIFTDGEVYPCSRYCNSEIGRVGNILDKDFNFNMPIIQDCQVEYGCCNKEDFIHTVNYYDRTDQSLPTFGSPILYKK